MFQVFNKLHNFIQTSSLNCILLTSLEFGCKIILFIFSLSATKRLNYLRDYFIIRWLILNVYSFRRSIYITDVVFPWFKKLINNLPVIAAFVLYSAVLILVLLFIFHHLQSEMAPRSETVTQTETIESKRKISDQKRPEWQIVWMNVYFMAGLHLMALYGIYLIPGANPRTWLWTWLCHFLGGLGITCGVHRLWSHRSYKATWPLRLVLMLMNCIAGQNDIFEWARDHRVHHKCSETDGDPHNATRGFFFSHVGWLMVKKHPDVIKKGKQLDLSDLYEDKIVMFQKR